MRNEGIGNTVTRPPSQGLRCLRRRHGEKESDELTRGRVTHEGFPILSLQSPCGVATARFTDTETQEQRSVVTGQRHTVKAAGTSPLPCQQLLEHPELFLGYTAVIEASVSTGIRPELMSHRGSIRGVSWVPLPAPPCTSAPAGEPQGETGVLQPPSFCYSGVSSAKAP